MWWWNGSGYWGHGWWGPGIVVMAVFMVLCMVMMGRMMRHGMGGSGSRPWQGQRPDGPERTLADRLASGEIDLEEYERLLDALQRTRELDRT